LQLSKSLFKNRKLFSSQLPHVATRCASAVPFAKDLCQFSYRESDGQSGSNQPHSSDTVWRKHPIVSGSSGGWKQKILPLVKTNSVRTYAGKTGQFTAIQGPSCGNFETHRISLKLGTSSKVEQISLYAILVGLATVKLFMDLWDDKK